MEALLYFDEMQNVNVNLLISPHRLMSTAQNSPGFTLRFAFRQSKATDPLLGLVLTDLPFKI